MFSKFKKMFITYLHLNSKELDLESDLLLPFLPSLGTFWDLLRFWVISLMIVVIIKAQALSLQIPSLG
jgi:hypothetical protein